jgi:hypothetical protein
LQAAVPGSLIDCNVIIKTAKKGESMTATKQANFLLKSTAQPKSSSDVPTVLLRPALGGALFPQPALTADGHSLQFDTTSALCTIKPAKIA